MKTAFVEIGRTADHAPAAKGKPEPRGEAFEDVLGTVAPKTDSKPGEPEDDTPRRLNKRTKREGKPKATRDEGKLAALVDVVATKLHAALSELTKGHVKPQGTQHLEQAFTQRSRAQRQPETPFPKLAKKGKNEDVEPTPPTATGPADKADKNDLPNVQRVLAPREPAPILATRATPVEVRLAATVQGVRPTAAVAPTNQYVQIQSTNEGGAAQIRLDLGNGTHLDVALDVRDGVARVHLRSNGADVTNKMAQSAGELVKALLDAGVDAAEVDIEWNEPEPDEQHKQRDSEHSDGDDEESDAEKFTSFVHIVT